MNTLKTWFDLGYGPPEFHRDLHAAIFGLATWAAIRIPEWHSFTADQFHADLKVAATLFAAKFVASYVTNSVPPKPPAP